MDPDDHPLPEPPEPSRLPPWLDDLRGRAGLDGRAVAWVAGAVVALLVGAWLLRPAGASVEESLPMASSSAPSAPAGADGADGANGAEGSGSGPTSEDASTGPAELVVHAAGAVVAPGVYTLPPTARVDDLVRAAGGLAPEADASRLNLAAPLADGARVYVPRRDEAEPPPVVGPDAAPGPAGGPGASGAGGDDGPAAPVDLNTATEAELDELPGIGPAIAAAIVAFREENGGFASVDDLLDVRGIGEAKLAELRPLVTV